MARQPQITRTIQTTVAEILCVNTVDETTHNETVILPRLYKDDNHILKAAEKVLNLALSKPVHVVKAYIMKKRYGMSEQKFIENAEELPLLEATEPEN